MSTVAEEIATLDRQIAVITDRRNRFTDETIRFLDRLEDPDDPLEVQSVNRNEILEVLAVWKRFQLNGTSPESAGPPI